MGILTPNRSAVFSWHQAEKMMALAARLLFRRALPDTLWLPQKRDWNKKRLKHFETTNLG